MTCPLMILRLVWRVACWHTRTERQHTTPSVAPDRRAERAGSRVAPKNPGGLLVPAYTSTRKWLLIFQGLLVAAWALLSMPCNCSVSPALLDWLPVVAACFGLGRRWDYLEGLGSLWAGPRHPVCGGSRRLEVVSSSLEVGVDEHNVADGYGHATLK